MLRRFDLREVDHKIVNSLGTTGHHRRGDPPQRLYVIEGGLQRVIEGG
jgi:hypothetical protein